ncbi:MAG TPA: hypothetical protein VK988_16845 [Acidimicrobiales bacterium]|nr:hypothetical protein [Acidimicrobiales bacterium]
MDRGRQRQEVWTWYLMAELAARAPVVQLIETHAGGGQYDTVEAFLEIPTTEAPPRLAVRCNRPGRVHIAAIDRGVEAAFDLLGDIDRGRPVADAVDEILSVLGGGLTRPDPAMASSLQLMASLLAERVGSGGVKRWEWRNGQLDSSGEDGGQRDDLFDAIPTTAASCRKEESDLLGAPGYRFWFLVGDGEPIVAIEPGRGRLFTPDGAVAVDSVATSDAVTSGTEPTGDASLTPREKAAALRPAFRQVGRRLAEEIAGKVGDFSAAQRLTERCVWLVSNDGERLVVVVGVHELPDAVDEVFAYALAWQHDRDLVIILPETRARTTLDRLPWVETPVRVFTYGPEHAPRPAIVPARAEVVTAAQATPVRATAPHELGALAAAAEDLRHWADNHWALVGAHRSSYLAWHCAGRQVLKLQRRGSELAVVAGVAYSGTPPPGEPIHVDIQLLSAPTAGQRAEIEAAVSAAVHRRLSGKDAGHREHRFQAALAAVNLGSPEFTAFVREYPAWRAEGRTGFIDFLALDHQNRLWVIETKVGAGDAGVVLQALDYAIWASAHSAEIRHSLRWPAPGRSDQVGLHLVLAHSDGWAVGPYVQGQLEALSGDVAWRVSLVEDPDADPLEIQTLPRRTAPPSGPGIAEPVQPPRWPRRVQLDRPAFHPDPAGAFLPGALDAYADLVERGLAHRFVLHIRSSQAFALNLFAPLSETGRVAVLGACGLEVRAADPVEFEWRDPGDQLHEARPTSLHTTQVDVVLRGTTTAGERVAALVEVKYTEADSGSCSAYENPSNPNRDVCRCAGPFGSRPDRCFQLLNHGRGRRRYDDVIPVGSLDLPAGIADQGGCLLRKGRNQPMRNLAVASVMRTIEGTAQVLYGVCAPRDHRAIWRRFEEVRSAFAWDGHRVFALAAEQVLAHHQDLGWSFRELYPSMATG